VSNQNCARNKKAPNAQTQRPTAVLAPSLLNEVKNLHTFAFLLASWSTIIGGGLKLVLSVAEGRSLGMGGYVSTLSAAGQSMKRPFRTKRRSSAILPFPFPLFPFYLPTGQPSAARP